MGDAAALFDRVAAQLKTDKDFHKLFDSRLMRKKFELGLPVTKPASLNDVPDSLRKTVEETYIAAAVRRASCSSMEGDIGNAWMYFQVIRDPKPVADAIEALPDNLDYNKVDDVLQVALHQGVNPVKGLRLMLKAHGTCSTITAFDQVTSNLAPEQRQALCQGHGSQPLHGPRRQLAGVRPEADAVPAARGLTA